MPLDRGHVPKALMQPGRPVLSHRQTMGMGDRLGQRLLTPPHSLLHTLQEDPWLPATRGECLSTRRRLGGGHGKWLLRVRQRRASPLSMAHRLFLHHPDKAIAIAPPRLAQPLRPPTISDGLTCQLDAALEGRITDVLPGPYLRAERVLRDQMRALF
jgi:hypothetical protein